MDTNTLILNSFATIFVCKIILKFLMLVNKTVIESTKKGFEDLLRDYPNLTQRSKEAIQKAIANLEKFEKVKDLKELKELRAKA